MPPTTNDDKDDRAYGGCHARLRDEGIAADHAGQTRERGAPAEHEHEDARDVVSQRFRRLGVRQRRLGSPARYACAVSSSQIAISIRIATNIMSRGRRETACRTA
jgi:hypothetical protein